MPTPMKPDKNERPNTYFVQDKKNCDELNRVTMQDRLVTASIGGVLPEQHNPGRFRRVLDVACGTGGWVIEAARTYPTLSLIGIDISQLMVDYARAQAEEQGVSDRVEFHVMDALLMLEFPVDYFDLVTLRFGVSFLRTWDWPKIIGEMVRVTGPGGVVRVVDGELAPRRTTSPAQQRFAELMMQAAHQAGNIFEPTMDGVTSHLKYLLRQYGYLQNIQEKHYTQYYHAGTAETQAYCAGVIALSRVIRPFLQKWGALPNSYDALCQQMEQEMQQPDYEAEAGLLVVWGSTSATNAG